MSPSKSWAPLHQLRQSSPLSLHRPCSPYAAGPASPLKPALCTLAALSPVVTAAGWPSRCPQKLLQKEEFVQGIYSNNTHCCFSPSARGHTGCLKCPFFPKASIRG